MAVFDDSFEGYFIYIGYICKLYFFYDIICIACYKYLQS